MSKADYLSLAQQACEKERQREWDEARALWKKAQAHTTASSQNENWAWARSVFCNVRHHEPSRCRIILFLNKIILFSSVLSVHPAMASTEFEPLPFFIGAKGGDQWALDDNYHHSAPEGSIFGVYSGLQFTPSWSWDVGYQYHDDLNADATSVNVKTWLIESALRYDWYLQNNLSLYGRLGAAYWGVKKTQPSLSSLDASGFSPLGELGVTYHISPYLRLSAGYQYIYGIGDYKSTVEQPETGQYNSHAMLLGLSYVFGSTQKEPKPEEPVVPEKMTFIFSEFSMGGEHFFDSDSYYVGEAFKQDLSEIAEELLIPHPESQVTIIGHTDSTGSESYNQILSEKRAHAVAETLISLGVNPVQIHEQGRGELEPVASNKTSEGRAKNRRAEITIPTFKYQQ